MASGDARWVEVTSSAFEHEQQGLEIVRALMPDETPYRAWSNFEFRDSKGGWHEVDLLLLSRDTLYLIELKHYYGTITGDDQTWRRDGRLEDSPLKLARRKAQRFASRLKDELRDWARESGVHADPRLVVPFVKEIVFLHHPEGRCALPQRSKIDLFGLPGREASSGLPGIDELFTRDTDRTPIGQNQERILVALMERIGLVQRRDRVAGSWAIEPQPIESGEGWQDWLAYHQVMQEERARIRFQVTEVGAPPEAVREQRRLAEHEFRVMSRLSHDGLLRPRDLVDSEMGIGLVYPYDEDSQRLDLWLAAQPKGVGLAEQLALVRQVAEALHYAHGNRVVHRALNPRAIVVRKRQDGELVVKVGDWQAAGSATPGSRTQGAGVTALHRVDVPSSWVDESDELDLDRAFVESFLAPEGVWSPEADRVRLDVFALGALTAYVLTGAPPAATAAALKTRLRQQHGIDIAVDLPQVSSQLRDLVLRATDPAPTRRLGDVGAFLALLARAERAAIEPAEHADPLSAPAGSRLDERFVLKRRLGQGSTAAGLLVEDALHQGERVLKVALSDDAAPRLDDEASVLKRLDHPRIVKLVEGPLRVGGRAALVLESAGTETLADELRHRTRLSLDLLDRFGTELLDALVALDKAGVDHRDIKPANLGVREGRGDRQKHLVLFDFSLTGAAASSTTAGTPPYLDPFFDETRSSYDSAAERYSAAVVLFEMATGSTPVYGDGAADPAVIADEATITRSQFDPSLASRLVPFFRKALARDPKKRHDTAEAMRVAWRAIFTSDATAVPEAEHDQLAAQATATTPLRKSGLTARELSAIEPLGVGTVGELLAVDPVLLSRLRGVADSTRKQVQARIRQWREALGPDVRPRRARAESLTDAAQLLLDGVTAKSKKDLNRPAMVRVVLGLDPAVDALATQAELGAHLPVSVTPARAGQILAELQETWARKASTRDLLDGLLEVVEKRLAELGGVATPTELTASLSEALGGEGPDDPRLARGLLRFVIERGRALHRAGERSRPLELRRREGVTTLVSTDLALFDLAEALGAAADQLVGALGDATSELVPAPRVQERLTPVLPAQGLPPELGEPSRLASLGAGTSRHARASARGELHTAELSPSAAIRHALNGFSGAGGLSPKEIRDRVAARFPALPPIPQRPVLDALVEDAGLGMVFLDRTRAYHPREVGQHTTGLETRRPTTHELESAPVSDIGPLGVRLQDSVRSRSFVALGVRPQRLLESVDALRCAFDAEVVDLTAVLLDALKAQTAGGRPSWTTVRAADAAAPGSRDRLGLARLVERAWLVVQDQLEAAVARSGPGPVLITEAAPLARYDAMALLGRWSDLAAARERAVWLLVPQTSGNIGPLLDGAPVPLSAPSQFVSLDPEWIDTTLASTAVATSKEP